MKRIALTTLALIASAPALAAPVTITLWRHESGDEEVAATKAAIQRFNVSQNKYRVVAENLPKGSYTEAITAAALAKKLPCVFDMDQPTVPNFAWAGYVRPLDAYLNASIKNDLSSGARGTYKGKLYSVGQFDVALALFARKSALQKAGLRIPTAAQPWTLAEFNSALAKLKGLGTYEYAIDLHNGNDGEWWSYAFSPWLQSFGGDLIDRKSMTTAEGALNGDAAVRFGEWFQSVFTKGYANKKPTVTESPFLVGRVPLDYNGSWSYADYKKKWGSDLLVLPSPNFGKGPKIGSGSWQWGISTSCKNPEGAAAFINFVMSPKEVAAISKATSLIPTTGSAAGLTTDYRTGGPARFFYNFAKNYALSRPPTPAYPILTSSFEKALRAIVTGANVQDTLDDAVDAIDSNIKRNKNYGF
ncbi:sugar ABC transporter substrate-binding protein [Deinococcus apachensis]|uniref:sugar ABC transporter substrate-binding protein n=1 Tax=Deinococcus apachensis TaxID=309886 RepID=UPI000375550F|nr:sugar ABC transporter substrate-binding protein [Deinococcus apachensis]